MDKLSVWKRKVTKEDRKRKARQVLHTKLREYDGKTTFTRSEFDNKL